MAGSVRIGERGSAAGSASSPCGERLSTLDPMAGKPSSHDRPESCHRARGGARRLTMKTLPIFLLSGVLAGSALGQNNAVKVSPAAAPGAASTNAPADPGAGKFKNDLEKHSYAMGVLLAGDIKL